MPADPRLEGCQSCHAGVIGNVMRAMRGQAGC